MGEKQNQAYQLWVPVFAVRFSRVAGRDEEWGKARTLEPGELWGLLTLGQLGCLLLMTELPAHAYTDPGSGLLAFQVLGAWLSGDGRQYKSREYFKERVAKINSYGRQWGADGYRAAVLYRRQDWFNDLEFSYDMSVPNVVAPRSTAWRLLYRNAVLCRQPARTACDNDSRLHLFHILPDYNIDLCKAQNELIMEKHGLLSVIVHPDYATTVRERKVYEALLSHLAELRQTRGVLSRLQAR